MDIGMYLAQRHKHTLSSEYVNIKDQQHKTYAFL